MKLILSALIIVAATVANATTSNILTCTEYFDGPVVEDGLRSVDFELGHDERGTALIYKTLNGTKQDLASFPISYSHFNGFIPELRIQNFDWTPRFNANLQLIGGGYIGKIEFVHEDESKSLDMRVRCDFGL